MSASNGNQDVDIDLGQLFAAVWERKKTILTATALAAVLAFVGASLMTPAYKAESRVLIENRAPSLNGLPDPSGANDPVLDALNIQSQAQLLQSTDLIKQVAREMKLSERKEFDPAAHSSLPNPLVMLGLQQNPLDLPPEDRVMKTFREKLQVYPVEGSRVIAIEFSSEDAKLAAAIPNRMAEVYLSMQSGAKLDSHAEAAKWLEPEIATLTKRVSEAEKKVADYRSSSGLFRTSDTNNLTNQQLNDISAELARVRGERANADARGQNVRNAIEAGRPSDTLSDVVGSAMIQRLKETEASLQGQISDLSTSLMEGHPRLKGLRAQLSGIRQQIQGETRKILASIEGEANVARLRETQLVQQLNGLKADTARAGEEEVGLRALEREATAQRQLLETYLARYREATSRIDRNSTPADARVISTAGEPAEPYFPKILPITIVVTLATLVISTIVVLLIALFGGRGLRPSNAEAIETAAQAKAIEPPKPVTKPAVTSNAVVAEPAVKTAVVAETVTTPVEAVVASEVVKAQDDAFSIEAVRDYIIGRKVQVAVAVSPGGDEGSTATVMLAREIAEAGRAVVLVDMTGSSCPTRLMANGKSLPGITDLLTGAAAFADTIHPDRLSDAHIVPRGIADGATAMRGADRLGIIIDGLAGAYDVVLVECGPAGIGNLARVARSKDADIVISAPGYDEKRLAEAAEVFETAGYTNLMIMAGTSLMPPTNRDSAGNRRRAA
ncbi:chain-length determining protein [Rhizobiales bacterium RZME27]|uniref:Chain-length determining protein n=1 Tax=Endobacterium cereale TaxID=2663029 RepID=A0A6A8AEZ4_9HYPH|nr:exopolysaccharide transport family protein [Endobacterium cereale]MEB2844064.1 exopolysaccharide transport family protein [Endobacterium cereale]MQY48478.1 chain-length determining protein [Endobacterium cereale]